MKNTLVLVMVSFALAGCAIVDRIRGKDDELEPLKPNPLPEIEAEVSLERQWQFDIGDGQAGLRPALDGGTVFVASPGGRVAAVDVETGKGQWRADLDIDISGGVGTGEGLVLLGGLNGEVVALDRRDGSEVWRAAVSSEVLAPPMATAGIVVVRTIDGGVTGLTTTSGERRWRLQRDEPSLTLRGSGPPLIDQNVAVLGFADGQLAAVNVDNGAMLWEVSVARPSGTNEVERMIDVDATPKLVGNALYAVAFQGSITAYALGGNRTMWRRDISSYSDFAADNDKIYLSDSLGRVHALDLATGEEQWVQEQLLRRRLSGPAVIRDYVVAGDYQGYLHVMAAGDGRLLGRRSFGDRISAQPLVRGDRILVLTEGGRLSAVAITREGG
ncbi:MAG TPA: outer membrane protein assembly factor BamB [Arenicellales bacterium]|nr:outer membrane protein assembly factor BamB [Arenicellales bacterium]